MNHLKQVSKEFYNIIPQFVHPLSAEMLLDDSKKTTKRTKTICTIGPKTAHPQNAAKLIDQGLSVARLNFSHGDHDEHLLQMQGVQQALRLRPQSHTSILLDTKGPEIRTGFNADKKPILLQKDQLLELTTDYSYQGNNHRIACSYNDLLKSAQVGKKILFADGSISSIIKKIQNNIVTVQILNEGKLGQKKNMCLPGSMINLPTITEYDETDIVGFGLKHKVDYIAVSFSRYLKDLKNLRKFLIEKDPQHGQNIHLISKIQNHEAVENIDEIIQGSDGIMVARGDLGMEVPIQKVVLLQKYIMSKTINAGKYVICATQMLQSMESKPRPTRAEISDITNAVLDLSDATMASGQTTVGQFPFEAARYLRITAQQSQLMCAYKKIFEYRKQFIDDNEAIGAIALSFERVCDLIFIQTTSIRLINRLSSLRPRAYICCFSDDSRMKKLTALNFATYCFPRIMKYDPEGFVKTLGKDLVNGPNITILSLQTNSSDQITNHQIIKLE